MKVTYQGAQYKFELLKIPVEELREVKRKLGLTVRQFLLGVAEVDVDAMLALRWCVLRSDGQHDDLLLDPGDPFPDYWQFAEAWNAALEATEEAEQEEDPTQAGSLPATSTPESSESSPATSSSSPLNTASPSPGIAESESGRSDDSASELSSATSSA